MDHRMRLPSPCSRTSPSPAASSRAAASRSGWGQTYDGKGVASFVYGNTYTVDELKGDRAVLDRKGICTAFRLAT